MSRRPLGLALAVLLGLGIVSTAPVSAAGSIAFGDPSARSTFGTGITFSQPVSAPGVNARYVEILITSPGSVGPAVFAIASPASLASTTLEYSLGGADQRLVPNTRYTAHWRVTDVDGTVSEGREVNITYVDTRFQWKSVGSGLVRVHWYEGDQAFGQRALAIGEAGIAQAEQLLGVTETEPVDFFVYADVEAFYDALGPGTRENVGGVALPDIRTLLALITPNQINDSWVGIVIPHELTHLVFDTAVQNPYHFPPRWLNEGLAVYLTQGLTTSDRALVRDAVRTGSVLPLPGIEGQFPTRRDKFSLAYAESVSAVDFLIRTYGQAALVRLITSYAGGLTDDEALTAAVGVDVAGFNAAWLADIGASPPTPHGPQPDPPGPLPAGWSSSPAPAGPVPSPGIGASPTSGSSVAGPAATASGAPLPTLGGAPRQPGATGAAGPVASGGPAATAGVITAEPAGAETPGSGAGWLAALGAVVLAALGIGYLIRRQRSPAPR